MASAHESALAEADASGTVSAKKRAAMVEAQAAEMVALREQHTAALNALSA